MSLTKVADDQLLPELVFKWRGLWETGTAYPINHLVKYDGSVYISIVNQSASNSTTCPSTGENWELCWELFVEGVGGGAGAPVVRETPAGLVNDSNTVFTLANALAVNTEQVFLNGVLQEPGGHDYTIAGQIVTFASAPNTGDRIRVSYTRS